MFASELGVHMLNYGKILYALEEYIDLDFQAPLVKVFN